MTFAAIESLLHEVAGPVKAVRPGEWRVEVTNGQPLELSARLRRNWLVLSTPAERLVNGHGPWQWLDMNRRLLGPSKLVVPPLSRAQRGTSFKGPSPRLMAEMPLDPAENLENRLALLCDSLKGSAQLISLTSGRKKMSTDRADGPALGDLIDRCHHYGWKARQSVDGLIDVPLPTRKTLARASLQPFAGGIRLRSRLVATDNLDTLRRRALAGLLVTACSWVRLVRGVRSRDRVEGWVGLECFVPCDPEPLTDYALSALSVAHDLCGPEAEIVNDRRMARRFLELRGWAPAPRQRKGAKNED